MLLLKTIVDQDNRSIVMDVPNTSAHCLVDRAKGLQSVPLFSIQKSPCRRIL
jgi:hypothetical protein